MGILIFFAAIILLFVASRYFTRRQKHADWENTLMNITRLRQDGNISEAIAKARHAKQTCREIFSEASLEYALILEHLGILFSLQGNQAEAKSNLLLAYDLRTRLQSDSHPDIGNNMRLQAENLWNSGDMDGAVEQYRSAIAIFEKSPDEANDIEGCYFNIANIYQEQGLYPQAKAAYKSALERVESTFGKNHIHTAQVLEPIAGLMRISGDYSEAISHSKQRLELLEKHLEKNHPDLATANNNLASLYAEQGKYKEAINYYQKAAKIAEASFGKSHLNYTGWLMSLVDTYRSWGKFDLAEKHAREILEIIERKLPRIHREHANILELVGNINLSAGKYIEALPYLEKALNITRKLMGEKHPEYVRILSQVVDVKISRGDDDSESLLLQLVQLGEVVYGPRHISTGFLYSRIAQHFAGLNRYDEAEQYYLKLLKVYEHTLGPHHPDFTLFLNQMIDFYSQTGKHAQAQQLQHRLKSIQSMN